MSTKIKRALFLLLAFAVLCAGCSRKEETAKEENPKIREQMALAEKYLGEQKFDEAIEALLEAVELDPEDVDVYLKLSEIYADQEMDMEAMDILEQGWEASQDEALRDRYVEVCTEYAEKYFNDEEFDSAIEAYDGPLPQMRPAKKRIWDSTRSTCIWRSTTAPTWCWRKAVWLPAIRSWRRSGSRA